MKVGRGYGVPRWITGFIGVCPVCKTTELITVLHDAKGEYYHCMICGEDSEIAERIQ